jgi:hypothetical protein
LDKRLQKLGIFLKKCPRLENHSYTTSKLLRTDPVFEDVFLARPLFRPKKGMVLRILYTKFKIFYQLSFGLFNPQELNKTDLIL